MIDESMFDKIRKMERDLAFYEHAIGVLCASLQKGSMQSIVMSGSYQAVQLVRDLNNEIKKVVGCK